MTIAEFDHLDDDKKKEFLQNCCGSSSWVSKMLSVFPVEDLVDLLEYADEKWAECTKEDWLEAFSQHPEIGEKNSVEKKFLPAAEWAKDEQAGTSDASQEILESLANGNKKYKEKFGYIFIVYATGRSAREMLIILEDRLKNNPGDEITIAATEQIRITKDRLEKLFA